MTRTPTDIQAIKSERLLQITWSDGDVRRYGFFDLRIACRCAACVDEITGEQILDPATVSPEITLDRAQLVGNYALRIHWSDGHNTGLYTWTHLASL